MTYKNIKFDDSPVMRSLEKLTLKNAKPEELKKIASIDKTADALKPSEDFSLNVLKLCKGLRQEGFAKYADEIESKFVQFKKAQTLYETSKETGEDLVDQAHPEGSHRMENVEGDAVVETITDRQKKIKEVISKTPTGKLASKNIINAVRILLAQETPMEQMTPEQLSQSIDRNMNALKKKFQEINQEIRDEGKLTFRKGDYGVKAAMLFSMMDKRPMTLDVIDEIKEALNDLWSFVKPGPTGGISAQAWDIVNDWFHELSPFVSNVKSIVSETNKRRRGHQETTAPAAGQEISQVEIRGLPPSLLAVDKKIDDNITKLNSWKAVVSTYSDQKDVVEGNQFIDGTIATLKKISAALSQIDPSQADALANNFNAQLATLQAEMDKFYATWIK